MENLTLQKKSDICTEYVNTSQQLLNITDELVGDDDIKREMVQAISQPYFEKLFQLDTMIKLYVDNKNADNVSVYMAMEDSISTTKELIQKIEEKLLPLQDIKVFN